MNKKLLTIGAGILISSAIVTTTVFAFNANSNQNSLENINKLKINYLNKNDETVLDINDKHFDYINRKLTNKNTKLYSDFIDDETEYIQKELEKALKTVVAFGYVGNASEVFVKDIKSRDLFYVSNENIKESLELKIKKIEEKSSDSSVAIITFVIKKTRTNEESLERKLEVEGFKLREETKPLPPVIPPVNPTPPARPKPPILPPLNPIPPIIKTKQLLNIELKKIEKVIYTGANMPKVNASKVRKNQLKFLMLSTKLEAIITNLKVKQNDPSTLLVEFKIKEKNGFILSDSKTIELNGFRKLGKTKAQLNSELTKVNAYFDGDVSTIKLTDPNNINVSFSGLSNGVVVTDVTKNIKHNDSSILVVNFRIREVIGVTKSYKKTVEIKGFFKENSQTPLLDKVVNAVEVEYDSNSKKYTLVKELHHQFLNFKNVDPNYFVVLEDVKQSSANSQIAIITIKVKQKNGNSESKIRNIFLDGFRRINEIDNSLNHLSRGIRVEYKNKENTFLRNQSDLENLSIANVTFSGFDDSKYWVTIKKLDFDRNGYLIFNLYLVDKQSGKQSYDFIIRITGFKF